MVGRVDLKPRVETFEMLVIELVLHLFLKDLDVRFRFLLLTREISQVISDVIGHVVNQEVYLGIKRNDLLELTHRHLKKLKDLKVFKW